MGMNWYGRSVSATIDRALSVRLNAAALYMVRAVKKSLNQPGPHKTNKLAMASEPGKPPHRRTGTLARSITHEVIGKSARVGSTMRASDGGYALYLERGTRKMAARPYLRPALHKNRKQISRILGKRIPG